MEKINLTFSDISDISTTLGVIISTLTLVSAFQLYKIGKRDNYIKNLRNTLISYQYNSVCLNNLVTFDISHELIYNVIYSKQLDRILSRIYKNHFSEESTKSKLKKELDHFPPITISIHTNLLNQFNELLRLNSQEASKIYTDYPSLYRVYEAINLVFSQTIESTKNLVRDEEVYVDLILDAYKDKKIIEDIEDFKDYIYYNLMSITQQKHSSGDQDDINDSLNILSLTTNSLMRLSDKELYNQMSNEKKISYKEFDETQSIFEDLHEAEKGLKLILKEEEILLFREYSTKIKVRNEK